MAIKIEMLRCFAAVAESGSLAKAADGLGRTPSAVSMMLKQFEDHLGEPLFESERKSRLTAMGAFTLQEAKTALEAFERAVTAMESFARAEAGFLRIAAVPSVAEVILPRVVRRFLDDHPGVRIDIRDMDSAGVLRELARERIDIGLATGGGTETGILRRTLFSDDFGVVCRADHPLAAETAPLEWPALAPWPFIANGLCRQITDQTFQRLFAASILMVRNTTSLLAMVRAGVGLTVLPRLVVRPGERDLSFLPLADPAARRRIDILRHAHNAPTPAARSFTIALGRTAREVVQAL